MKVIAHRGASGHLPENTLPAYELAIEMRADMIEIDLHRTRDGAIVIAHDEVLPGLGGPDGAPDEIGRSDLEVVRALDVGDGERVPLLDEVLDGFASRIPFNLEIKASEQDGEYPGLEEEVVAALRARGLGADILFSSFRPGVLERLRALDADARLALLVSPRDADISLDAALEQAVALGCEALNPHWVQADEDWVARSRDAGLQINVYTVNEISGMRRMLDLGVDGVFTNFPDQLRALLEG